MWFAGQKDREVAGMQMQRDALRRLLADKEIWFALFIVGLAAVQRTGMNSLLSA